MNHPSRIDANGTPAYVALPGSEIKGAVIVCFEIFGLNRHIEDLCRRFAKVGYIAAAPDFYHRCDGQTVISYSDRESALTLANTLTDESVMADIESVFRYLQSQLGNAHSIGIAGYCLGGRLAFLAACRNPGLAACVSFYGGGIPKTGRFKGLTAVPLDEAASIRTPMFLAFGGQDQSIPSEDVEQIRDRLAELGKEATIEVYPDAGHGFMCEERESYDANAAKDGWAKTIAFLNERIG
jgi:carboxymethylenebutenolidase